MNDQAEYLRLNHKYERLSALGSSYTVNSVSFSLNFAVTLHPNPFMLLPQNLGFHWQINIEAYIIVFLEQCTKNRFQ